MANETPQIQLPFTTSHAFIIGINDYQHLSPLSTAINDAEAIAHKLGNQHGFKVHKPLLNATYTSLKKLLTEQIPQLVQEDDRVLFYFAGHGIALDGEEGPNGYLVAADTRPGKEETLIPMQDLHDALATLPCRHGLLILDCCFSGAFKWSSGFRDVVFDMPKVIYEERFWRYCKDPAWQVITSAAHDQKAVDIITNQSLGLREDTSGDHSPFANSLLRALDGEGDVVPSGSGDGVITATELYSYLRDSVETETTENAKRQSPSIFNLQRHGKGEFIFLHPNHRFNLPPTPDRNPFMGLSSYNEADANLFYGRDRVVEALLGKVKRQSLIVVSGASGTGKSSVIKAGVLPQLRKAGYQILPIIRPGKEPVQTINSELPNIKEQLKEAKTVLVIDQYEELITQCLHPEERIAFEQQIADWLRQYPDLRIMLSIRSDFEPQFESEILAPWWQAGRYVVPSFSLEEVREVITKPAAQAVLFFEPEDLIEQLSEEVSQAPGALPLLSFTLSELYHAYLKSGREDRALTQEDYNELGGVIGALRTRADAEYKALDSEEKSSMRKLMLRMVSLEGGELAGKRVYDEELNFSNTVETQRLQTIANQLVDARLLLKGTDGQGRSYTEPAHDALVRAWARLWEWIKTVGEEKISLQYKLSQAVNDYNGLLLIQPKKAQNLLWNNNPRLDLLQAELAGKDHGLNAREESFIRASIQRRTARKRISWSIAVAVMIGLASLSLFAFSQRNEALAQTKIAQNKTIEAQDSARVAQEQRAYANIKQQEALDSARVAQEQRGIAFEQTEEAQRQTGIARTQRDRANQKAREATAGALTVQARALVENDPTLALNLVYEAFQLFPNREIANTFNFVNNDSRSFYKKRSVQGNHIEGINTAKLQNGGGFLLTTYFDFDMRYVDVMNLAEGSIESFQFSDTFYGDGTINIDPNGEFLYTSNFSGVEAFDIENQRSTTIIESYGNNENVLAIASDGSFLLIENYNDNSEERTIQQWDISSQPAQLIQSFNGLEDHAIEMVIAPKGDAFIAASNSEIGYWKMGQAAPVYTYEAKKNVVNSLAFAPNGQSFISGTSDGLIQLWDINTTSSIDQTSEPLNAISQLVFSEDGQRFLSCSNDAKVRLWSIDNLYHPIRSYSLGSDEIAKMAFFSNKQDEIYSIGYDPLVSQGASDIQTLVDGTGSVSMTTWPLNSAEAVSINSIDDKISLLSSGQEFITIKESVVELRAFQKSTPIHTFSSISNTTSVALSNNDDFIAIGTQDGSISLQSIRSKKEIHRFNASKQSLTQISLSPNGQYLASIGKNKEVIVWSISDKKNPQLILRTPKGSGKTLDFSTDSKRLLIVGNFPDGSDANIYATSSGLNLKCIEAGEAPGLPQELWNYDRKMKIIRNQELGIPNKKNVQSYLFTDLTLSPDNRFYAGIINTGSAIDSLKIWDLKTGQVMNVFNGGHGMFISDVAYSPDGNFLLTCGQDEFIRMWHTESGELIRTFKHGGSSKWQIGFSKDGSHLFSNNYEEVILWKNPFHDWDDRIYRFNKNELAKYLPTSL